MSDTEHLILTVVMREAEWEADPAAVLKAARTRLDQRARHRGLCIDGAPREEVTILDAARRVRITLTAQAQPVSSEHQQLGASDDPN